MVNRANQFLLLILFLFLDKPLPGRGIEPELGDQVRQNERHQPRRSGERGSQRSRAFDGQARGLPAVREERSKVHVPLLLDQNLLLRVC